MSTTQVILLEKIRHKGNLGDVVSVRAGFARNFLLPKRKAIKASQENLQKFEDQRIEFEKRAIDLRMKAEERALIFQSIPSITIVAKATEENGKLYGSIGISDIIEAMAKLNIPVERSEIRLPLGVIRYTGEHDFTVYLHSEISVKLKLLVTAE